MKLKTGFFGALLLIATSFAQAEWGRDATIRPGWDELGRAAKRALTHPMTWIPAVAGAAVFASGRDDDWTEELHEDAPVFGSSKAADDASDDYRTAADALWVVSILATDSGAHPFRNKARGALVQVAALGATFATSNLLKSAIDRDEPGKSSDKAEGDAFPSNHTTGAFAHAALVRENMKQTKFRRSVANIYTGAAYIAATGSAWGRIEAGGHHLSDQLVGAAIGNFMATFINDAFMGSDSRMEISAGNGDSLVASWTKRF